MKKLILIVAGYFGYLPAILAQDSLALNEVLEMVRLWHPLTRVAELTPMKAQAGLRSSRGLFDPSVYFDQSEKTSSATQYYNLSDAKLELPTRSPFKLESGFENASGAYLNPQESIKGNDQYYTGISANLLRDLITDKRRTLLRQSKLMVQMSRYEQQVQLNDLGTDVVSVFLDWVAASREVEIYDRAVVLTKTRLAALEQEIAMGARAEIDTLETSILFQNYSVLLREARYKQFKARMMVNSHIWTENLDAPVLRSDILPDLTGWNRLEELLILYGDSQSVNSISAQNPQLLSLDIGVKSSRLDLQLKQQQLLPELKLKYHVLSGQSPFGFDAISQNHRMGITFSSPLFLRQARGDMAKSRFEMNSLELKLQQKIRETQLKNHAALQQVKIYSMNYESLLEVTLGYEKLFETELMRVEAGESDLFLLNTRQMRMIDAEIKLVSQWFKMQHSKLSYLYQSGVIYQLFSNTLIP